MISDVLLDHPSGTHKIEAFYKALKSVGEMDVKPVRAESWFDDLYNTNHRHEYENQDDLWMDDLDEAA